MSANEEQVYLRHRAPEYSCFLGSDVACVFAGCWAKATQRSSCMMLTVVGARVAQDDVVGCVRSPCNNTMRCSQL